MHTCQYVERYTETMLIAAGLLVVVQILLMMTASAEGWICKRTTLEVNYGFDAALQPLNVDVGMCTLISDSDANSTDGPVVSCVPDSSEMQTYSNRSGPFDVAVVTSCSEMNVSSCCGRYTSLKTFFSNSRYETTVDVGTCEGQCAGDNTNCAPKRSRQISVNGPNGDSNAVVVEECACADSRCRREDYFLSFWEVVTPSNDINESRLIVKEKVINIGRCTGECAGVRLQPRCYPFAGRCLQIGEQAKCVPSNAIVHTFFGIDGYNTSIVATKDCECLSG